LGIQNREALPKKRKCKLEEKGESRPFRFFWSTGKTASQGVARKALDRYGKKGYYWKSGDLDGDLLGLGCGQETRDGLGGVGICPKTKSLRKR